MSPSRTGKMVTWKVVVPESTQDRYRLIASLGGVPADRLVTYVLDDWTRKNRSLLAEDNLTARLKGMVSSTPGPGAPK